MVRKVVRKVTPDLFPIDSVKVLPKPDLEKVRDNLKKYKETLLEDFMRDLFTQNNKHV